MAGKDDDESFLSLEDEEPKPKKPKKAKKPKQKQKKTRCFYISTMIRYILGQKMYHVL